MDAIDPRRARPCGLASPRPSTRWKMFGAAAIAAALLGLLWSLHRGEWEAADRWTPWGRTPPRVWLHLWTAAAIAVSALHLVGGVLVVCGRGPARSVLLVYAVAAIALAIADIAVCTATMDGWVWTDRCQTSTQPAWAFDVYLDLVAMAWPLFVFGVAATASRPARGAAACGRLAAG